MSKAKLSIREGNVEAPLPEVPERRQYLLRGHWAGRLVVLGCLTLLLAYPLSLLLPVHVFETHAALGLILASLILSPWFGLGKGGLLGLRLSRKTFRLIVVAGLAAVTFAVLIVVVSTWMTHSMPHLSDFGFFELLFLALSYGAIFVLSLVPGIDFAGAIVGPLNISAHPDYLFFTLVHAVAEEMLFRGILLIVLAERYGAAVAIVGTSLAFAGVHFIWGDPGFVGAINLMLLGLILAVSVLRGASIWFAIVFHAAWNLLAVFKMGLPMGGVSQAMEPFFVSPEGVKEVLAWHDLLLGTLARGPEAGLLMTLLLTALGLWLLPRTESWADPVLVARGFKRRLLESRLREAHRIQF